MKSKFDHEKLKEAISNLKVWKMCDEVACYLENSNVSDNVLLSDVLFSNGNIEAKFYFSNAVDLKDLLALLNPLPLAMVGNSILPTVLAKKMGTYYEETGLNIDRIDADTIFCYTMITDEGRPKYFVRCIMQFIKR